MASNCDFNAAIYANDYLREENLSELNLKDGITPAELLTQVQKLLSGKERLLSRRFVLPRDVGDVKYVDEAEGTLRVMQWNILAQSLSSGTDNFIRCPPDALVWKFRRLRLLEEILLVNPDVICLQEVDHFGFFRPIMKCLGYEGSFFPKPSSPCLTAPASNGPDGCVLFYRTSVLTVLGKESIVLKDSSGSPTNQVCIIYRLAFKCQPSHDFVIATTHLKAKVHWSNLRKEQGEYLSGYLLDNYSDKPIVLCGDFNAEYSEPVYQVIADSSLNLESSYKLLNEPYDAEPLYTTWKIRGKGETEQDVSHSIDYMFYTQESLVVESLLSIPTDEEIGPDRLPSIRYPSDHFSLAADFSFK